MGPRVFTPFSFVASLAEVLNHREMPSKHLAG
jgi:hypothetical protein